MLPRGRWSVVNEADTDADVVVVVVVVVVVTWKGMFTGEGTAS
jgi:hypothetical protein